MIRKLFIKTFNFWFISKILLSVLLIIFSFVLIIEGDLRAYELLWNLFGLILGFLLGIIVIVESTSKPDLKMLRVTIGITLIVLSIILFVVLVNVSKGARSDLYPMGYVFSIWMILIGFFETMNIKKIL